MASFPTPPFSLNQIHTDGGRSWKWDGSRWKRIYSVIAAVVSPTPPDNPTTGMRWINPTLGRSFDYLGNAWVETTSGAGANGREVQFQKSATHVQWRYVGDLAWTDLVALADFAAGADGSDGREVQFQKSATHIQWQYVGDLTWTDLVALDDLKGADGNDGAAGADGNDGAAGADGNDGAAGADGADALWNFTGAYNPGQVYAIGDLATYAGETWYRKHANGGNVGDTPSEGAFWTKIAQKGLGGSDGREVEFQKSETYIQWRYVNDPEWTDLVALDDLKGADGNDGAAGADGREVEFHASTTHLQWRYVGEEMWVDLVEFSVVSGHQHVVADITDFPDVHDASILTSGTLDDARLSSNVVLTSDSRLSDSRMPVSHSHTLSDITNFPTPPVTGTRVLAVIDGVLQWVSTQNC